MLRKYILPFGVMNSIPSMVGIIFRHRSIWLSRCLGGTAGCSESSAGKESAVLEPSLMLFDKPIIYWILGAHNSNRPLPSSLLSFRRLSTREEWPWGREGCCPPVVIWSHIIHLHDRHLLNGGFFPAHTTKHIFHQAWSFKTSMIPGPKKYDPFGP